MRDAIEIAHPDAWLVGRYIDDGEWHVQGVFSTREKAIDACRDHTYFVMPMEMDYNMPHRRVDVVGTFYPITIAI